MEDNKLDIKNSFENLKYSVVAGLTEEEEKELREIRREIIKKIKLILDRITVNALKRASLSSRGSTLKSLMNAFHLVQIHLEGKDQERIREEAKRMLFFSLKGEVKSLPEEESEDKEFILEKVQKIILKQRENFFHRQK